MANVPIYKNQGGDTLTIDSDGALVMNGTTTLGSAAGLTVDGTLTIGAAGELDVVAGGSITDDGTQASAISTLAITYTGNDPSITPDGAVTVADGSTPTVSELLELCEELTAQTNAILAALRGVGIVASS